jgi:hypothetical protein
MDLAVNFGKNILIDMVDERTAACESKLINNS